MVSNDRRVSVNEDTDFDVCNVSNSKNSDSLFGHNVNNRLNRSRQNVKILLFKLVIYVQKN